MKKLLASTAIAMSLTLLGSSADAATYASYYTYAAGLKSTTQINFVNSMIRNYENSNRTYKGIIDRYKVQFGSMSWFIGMEDRYNFQMAEIKKLRDLIGKASEISVINTTVVRIPNTIVTPRPAVEVNSVNTVEVEQVGNMIREYAVVTKTFETSVRTIFYDRIETTKTWSNNTKSTEVTSEVTNVTNNTETNVVLDRTLIREYTAVVSDAVKSVTLTEAEYLARDDVNYTQGTVYQDAVNKMNPNISAEYAQDVLGRFYGNHLDLVGAPAAWSRGYTGKGSTIAILDTGIDMDHPEFADRIIAAECFTRACELGVETIDDKNKYSHGTHVAGLAAAALDGVGTTGVAPDANLLIGKVAHDSGFYDFNVAGKAISWAVENGADVINMSGNYNIDTTYKNSVVSVGDGVYKSNDTRGNYATLGYTNLMGMTSFRGSMEAAMAGNEAVLVVAAGNQGLDYPTFPAHYAVATNAAGELSFGGRMIVAGNWDNRALGLARTSNRAGTMCFDFAADGACTNTNRISDYYIMAPGTYVASTVDGGDYSTLSGTSMAAPVVTGGVALLHQMWPHMTGSNLVKLMMNTGDKSFAGYNVNVHGQGLMDLDEATKPQGALGLPTTGRVDGTTSSVTSGNIALGGATIASLGDVMVIDDYDRDFYMPATAMVSVMDTRTANPTLAAQAGFTPDYYMGFGSGQMVPLQNAILNINSETNDASFAYQSTAGLKAGLVKETGKFLGNIADSDLMRVNGSTTAYLGYTGEHNLSGATLFGSATIGISQLSVDNSSAMKSASTVMSNSMTAGAKTSFGKHEIGFVTSMPVAITSGSANFDMASSVSASGDLSYSNTNASLASTLREVDFGVFYNIASTDRSSISSYAELRTNYAGTNTDSYAAGIKYEIRF